MKINFNVFRICTELNLLDYFSNPFHLLINELLNEVKLCILHETQFTPGTHDHTRLYNRHNSLRIPHLIKSLLLR